MDAACETEAVNPAPPSAFITNEGIPNSSTNQTGSMAPQIPVNNASEAPYTMCEDPYPSLSDFHDYEPQLEFDDAELLERREEEEEDYIPDEVTASSVVVGPNGREYTESPMSDGTIEEDFEEVLAGDVAISDDVSSPITPCLDPVLSTEKEVLGGVEDFSDLTDLGIVDVVGDDKGGRKIIVVSACKLPPNKDFDNQRFLRYLMTTLDQFVDMDYSLVYFHHGVDRSNRLPTSWLWGLYKTEDTRKTSSLSSLFIQLTSSK